MKGYVSHIKVGSQGMAIVNTKILIAIQMLNVLNSVRYRELNSAVAVVTAFVMKRPK